VLTAADIQNLITARTNFAQALANDSANPRPTYTVGNQTMAMAEYFQYLRDQIDALDVMIQEQQNNQRGAWEFRSRGLP
jgi:hypothetical protein